MSRSVDQDLFQLGPLLGIDQAQVVGVSSHFRQDFVGMSETISDGDPLETSQKTSLIDIFSDLLGDGRDILPSIALTKDNQRIGSGDVEVVAVKASLAFVELVQSLVEILSHLYVSN